MQYLILILVVTHFSHLTLCIRKDAKDHLQVNLLRFPREASPDDDSDDHEYTMLDKNKADEIFEKNIDNTTIQKGEINRLELPEGYNRYEIPKHESGKPIKLYIQLNIKKILDFDELNEQVKLDVEFRVLWTDFKLLEFNNRKKLERGEAPKTIENLTTEEIKAKRRTLNNPNLLEKVWRPNLFFENLLIVKQPTVMAKPVSLKIIPEVGWFEYLTRLIVTLDCEMAFNYYPADTQTCPFSIRGFSYTKKDLNLEWYKTGVWLWDLNLPSFDVRVDNLEETFLEEDDEDPAGDEFDVLGFSIIARRKLSYHLVQTYLASTFYVVITCLCFLLPARLVEARIGICMTTLLTLTLAMFASVRESTPIVSYVKAIDTWMVGCIFFVFLTLAEFTMHIWLQAVKDDANESEAKKDDKEIQDFTERRESRDAAVTTNGIEMQDLRLRKTSTLSTSLEKRTKKFKKLERYEKMFSLIENFSFPVFILILVIFSSVYWTWLINSSDYMNWTVDEKYNNVEEYQNIKPAFEAS